MSSCNFQNWNIAEPKWLHIIYYILSAPSIPPCLKEIADEHLVEEISVPFQVVDMCIFHIKMYKENRHFYVIFSVLGSILVSF